VKKDKYDDLGFAGVDDAVIKREKAKARELRRSRWWQQKIASGICYFCGEKFPPKELTMDHLVPLSRGGTSRKSNLVPACKECNTRKKISLPFEMEDDGVAE
jgi:5-methylcytosine-specific restriction endonuclease McrA